MSAFHPLRTSGGSVRYRPIADIRVAWEHASMNAPDDGLSSFRDGHWKVQPGWVKALTFLIGLPAWLIWAASILIPFDPGELLQTFLISAMSITAALQAIFVFRAYWRMDV